MLNSLSFINSSKFIGIFLAILSGILYGSLGYLGVTQLSPKFSINDVLFWRFFLAGILLLPFAFKSFNYKKISLKDSLLIFFLGGGFYGLSTLFYFWSATKIGTGISMVIFFTFPLFVAFLSWIFDNSQFDRTLYLSVILTIIGLFLLAGNINSTLWCKESLWGLAAGFCFALYIIISKKIALPPLKVTVLVCLGNAFTIWAVGCCSLQTIYYPSLEAPWIKVILMALIATAIPILLFLESIRRICATQASLLAVFEPITAVIIGVLILGESLVSTQYLGILILLMGTTLANYKR